MQKPKHVIDVFLQPGEFYFGEKDIRIRTLLGSCVSITLWHPGKLIGGMCHYMLPTRGGAQSALDGRYADEAMLLFMREIELSKTHPAEYEVKLFGGGNMFPQFAKSVAGQDVPARNVEAARRLAKEYGFKIAAENLGGNGHRQILFDIWSGHVWVKQPSAPNPS